MQFLLGRAAHCRPTSGRLLRLIAKYGPEETALITEDAFCLFGELERRDALGIFHRVLAITLIRGKAWKAEHRHGDIVRAFGRQEIAVMLAAEFFNEGNPQLSIVFERCDLVGIEYIFQITSDHVFALLGWKIKRF